MMKKNILLAYFCIGLSMQSFAHYMWIETNATGSMNKAQEVRVYFGEYTYGVTEQVGGEAFEKVKNFTLWVVDPSGNKLPLEVIAKEAFYAASFIPKMNGTYTVILNNDQIDVIDYTKYDFGIFKTHYHGIAKVQVGSDEIATSAQNEAGLTISQLVGKEGQTQLQVTYKGKPLAEHEVTVFVSDHWSKKLETDEQGLVSFSLPWNTKYIVEVTKEERVPGAFRGVDYEFIWHCVTHCINN